MRRDIIEKLKVSDEDSLTRLYDAERSLSLISNITGNDVFLDCYDKTGNTVIVAAHARPDFQKTLYSKNVVGKKVLPEMEPAVFETFKSGIPSRDLKAVTQEGRMVRQDIIPICDLDECVIGVVIREKDISENLRREEKYRALSERDSIESNGGKAFNDSMMRDLAIRESHHRIKNDLQMIASMINLQARKTDRDEVRSALHESAQRVLSIAAIQETLICTEGTERVNLIELLNRVCRNVQNISCESRQIAITVTGDELSVLEDSGTSLAVIANELVSNAAIHAFECGENGKISVKIKSGRLYSTMTVEDNGSGFDVREVRGNLGFEIVRMTAEEKLRGKFTIVSDENGTKASVDFLMQ